MHRRGRMSQTEAHEQSPRGGGGRAGAARAFAAWWVLCAALWLALVDRTRLDELLTGVVAATLGATAAVLVRQERRIVLRPRLRWLAAVRRPLVALFADLWPLARALVLRGVLRRPGEGRLVEVPFDAVADTPRDAAFRVLTATLGSLGPNTIVVDVDTDERVLRVHQLEPTPDPARAAMPLERP
jgi:multisubunit Na+/H+ antiporter MnhE subunit